MHIVFIASTPFHRLHHRSQRLARAFLEQGFPVTYVEQTYGWRAYVRGERSGLPRATARALLCHLRAGLGLRSAGPGWPAREGFRLVEMPLVVPMTRINSARVERMNARVFRNVLVSEVLPLLAGEETVALIDNPLWSLALRRGDFTRMFYDCIDDISLYAGRSTLERFREYERGLLRIVDGVFVTAAGLEAQIRSLDSACRVVRIPNGVDPEWFEERAACGAPDDAAALKRPVVGYIGNIADWFAYETVAEAAAALPEVTFLFVGPVDFQTRLKWLQAPNMVLLGRKPYADVPRYIAACDVCWIPFARGPLVDNTNPIKLFEYFALGKPVVTTPLPEAAPFAAERLSYTGEGTRGIVQALQAALAEDEPALRAARKAVARRHAWTALAGKMRAEMAQQRPGEAADAAVL